MQPALPAVYLARHGETRLFLLSTEALSILGYEHALNEPAIRLWNDDRHVV